MKKKFNIVKLSGLKGLLLFAFVGACLLTGFLVFPGWVAMNLWNILANFVSAYSAQIPQMNLIHGVILWCIIALSIYAVNKGNVCVSFKSVSPSEEKMRKLIAEETKELLVSQKEETSEDKDKVAK